MDIRVYVVTHKEYQMPQDGMYIPLQVGFNKSDFEGYLRDDTGDNIADKNARMCELTAIYWAWKNTKSDYIGFAHYRRHFKGSVNSGKSKFDKIASGKEIEKLLSSTDIIVPSPRHYLIESIESHHLHLPHTFDKDYEVLKSVICELSPDYVDSFNRIMHGTSAHMFNMYVMRWELFDDFCSWMFPILLECDRRIDVVGYTTMETRAVAYFGEFMIDVWMEKNNISYREMDVLYMEKQDWINKGISFVLRKFGLKDFFYVNR